MILRTLLRAKLHPLEVTEASITEPDALILCPQLVWAAELAELEQVEVYNRSNGMRFTTYLKIGKMGEVLVNGSAAHHSWPGDTLTVAAFVLLSPEAVIEHAANIVEIGKGNAPSAIQRRFLRTVSGHPSYVPVDPQKIVVSTFSISSAQSRPDFFEKRPVDSGFSAVGRRPK